MKENRYYVYLHKIASTGEVFYVGKGQRSRLTNTDRRNTTWNAIVSEKEWFAEKYMDNLSSDEAAALEVKLIAELAPVANFHKKDVRPRALNKADFESLYYYCENSKADFASKEMVLRARLKEDLKLAMKPVQNCPPVTIVCN